MSDFARNSYKKCSQILSKKVVPTKHRSSMIPTFCKDICFPNNCQQQAQTALAVKQTLYAGTQKGASPRVLRKWIFFPTNDLFT